MNAEATSNIFPTALHCQDVGRNEDLLFFQ